ncbi:hypothetical protein B0J18DRAFT_171173 [Chaetomium sp. MPI-SDFR-AT-0129]|nr:hypothetical protein B0J18DRAFT_171173 [Chaetomium sp. MPI-SDFR-AT-0129]
MSDKMSVDKKDPSKDDSEESMESSPEGEVPSAPPQQQAESQQPKRKGGRKPIYATSEERKQRNRQAQAAFRERRTEYIKQLEEAIRTHEQNLANLQAAHRHAADECLMLRYKNSLLERILLEKGIDVQAELRAKTGSPNLGPTHVPQNLVQPPPIQRAILNRHHARRSTSGVAPKLEPGIPVSPLPPPMHAHASALSPKNRHTPSSHSASPTGTATFGSQQGASPAASESLNGAVRPAMPPIAAMKGAAPHLAPLHGLPGPRQIQVPNLQQQAANQARGAAVGPAGTAAPFYPTPSFQNHIEQLEQEYDAAADMMDDPEAPDTPSGPGPYPGASYTSDPQPMSLSSPVTSAPPGGQPITGQPPIENTGHTQNSAFPSMTQLLDPNYDFDPFGLSASMAFPTQFSFDTSNMR